MMPWNPIHRYAGLQSSLEPIDPVQVDTGATVAELYNGVSSDPFGHAGSHDRDVSLGHAGGVGESWAYEFSRRPLGFVNVRSDAGEPDDADAGSHEATDEQPDSWSGSDVTAASDGSSALDEEIAVDRQSAHADPGTSGDDVKTPFYKRELSFGRRKAAGAAAAIADAPASDDEVAVVDVPETDAELVADEAPPPTDPAELSAVGSASADVADAADEPVAEPAEEPMAAAAEDAHNPEPETAPALEWPEEPTPVPVAEEGRAEPSTEADHESVSAGASESTAVTIISAEEQAPSRSRGKGRDTKSSRSRNGQRRGGRVVGLKIGASQLAAAVIEDQNGRPELVELARTPLEAGIVVDGEIRDPEALTNALRSFFADHKLPTKDVRIGIASNRIGVRTFEIAGVDDGARFDNAVRFKAHEVLPIAGSDAVLDYRVLDERQTPTGETTRRIFLVVAPRDQVAPYAETAQRAGLKVAGIDLESLGLLRAFVEPQDVAARKDTDTATVVVAIGHEASTLMVSGGGVCEFTRVFDWGGSTLQDAIVQELEVRPAEAATILRNVSLAGGTTRIEGLDDEARSKAVEAIRLRLTPFARELVSSLQFYQTQPDSLGIGEIVITGGVSQLDGLADALHQMIGVAVRVGDPLQRVTARAGVDTGFEHVIGSLAVAIGLGIDDGAIRSVNLMPGDLAKVASRKPRLLPVLLPIAAVVPLVAAGFLFMQAHGKVSDRQSQLDALNFEFTSLPQPKRPQIDAALQGLQAQRASAVAQVLGARTAWDTMLSDFARVLPGDVWLTTLSARTARPLSTPVVVGAAGATPTSATTPATPAAPTGVTITGFTYAQPDVATLLARLSALPSLQNVQLQTSQAQTVGKRDVVQFTILADLRETGGAS